ncbi:hypothetical protein Q5H92_16580 [Hymenobacter sp. M29]|uniref:Histidine kinase N-terminal 7TM region domain-containing protein n=1 Tax=Hymenobacter mellowenesis TaxID=3063995 RepID=A0ABT9AEJ2_9BACT|nr:hypothetical protein [Hymenobacter sp. M29]MDO7847983.1 hypothetical protein [Hymenobacter sp. M29]
MPYFVKDLVLEASFVAVGAAGVVGAVRFRRLGSTLRYLVALIGWTLFMEVASRVLVAQQRSNLFLFPLDTLVEFGLLAGLYRRALWPSAVSRGLPAVAAVFALVSLLSYLEPAALLRFNTGQRFAESLLVLGLALLYFYKVIRELVIVHLQREPLFWISVGLLLYFAGNVFIFISSNYVMQHSSALSLRLWDIHAWLYMVLYGLFAWALWISPSTKR